MSKKNEPIKQSLKEAGQIIVTLTVSWRRNLRCKMRTVTIDPGPIEDIRFYPDNKIVIIPRSLKVKRGIIGSSGRRGK